MLEMFFDSKRVFSVFEQILKDGSQEVNVFNICFNLGLSPNESSEIIKDFVMLGILDETDELEKGIFHFNVDSPVVMGICLFDDFIGKFILNKLLDEGDNDLHNFLKSFNPKNHLNDEDFVEFLKENGLKL